MRSIRSLIDVRSGEYTKTICMSLYFFVFIAAYWFLKPLRSALTIEKLGADAIAQLKVITAFASAGVVAIYSVALTRFSRERLTYLIIGTFCWIMLFFGWFFSDNPISKFAYYSFYIFVDLFITVNIALFWTFMADVTTPDSASRLYGVIGAGGVAGGFVGSLVCNSVVDNFTPAVMILLVAFVYSFNGILVYVTTRRLRRDKTIAQGIIAEPKRSRLSDALEGAAFVLRNKYFLGIAGIIAGYEFISAVNDFTFHKSVDILYRSNGEVPSIGAALFSGIDHLLGTDVVSWLNSALSIRTGHRALGEFFSEFFLVMNIIAVLVQLFLSSLIIRAFGVGFALLSFPVLLIAMSSGFLAFPVFGIICFMFLFDNSFNYSLNQTAREILFVPVGRQEKYKALAFTDMFVQRMAKAVAGFILLLLPVIAGRSGIADLRYNMLLTLPLGVVWFATAWYLGRRFRRLVAQPCGGSRSPGSDSIPGGAQVRPDSDMKG